MKYTESHFGLQEVDGKVTADNGMTFLKKYNEMSTEEWHDFVRDVENWLGCTLSNDEAESLIEIME